MIQMRATDGNDMFNCLFKGNKSEIEIFFILNAHHYNGIVMK